MADSVLSRIWGSAFRSEIKPYVANVGPRGWPVYPLSVLDVDLQAGHSGGNPGSGSYVQLNRESDGRPMALVGISPDQSGRLADGDNVVLVRRIDRYFWVPRQTQWLLPPKGSYIDVDSIIWE